MGKGKPENGTTSAYSYCVDLTSACLRPCFMLDLLTVLRSTGTFTQHLTKFMFGVLYFNMPFINDLGSTIDTDVFCFVSTFFRAPMLQTRAPGNCFPGWEIKNCSFPQLYFLLMRRETSHLIRWGLISAMEVWPEGGLSLLTIISAPSAGANYFFALHHIHHMYYYLVHLLDLNQLNQLQHYQQLS